MIHWILMPYWGQHTFSKNTQTHKTLPHSNCEIKTNIYLLKVISNWYISQTSLHLFLHFYWELIDMHHYINVYTSITYLGWLSCVTGLTNVVFSKLTNVSLRTNCGYDIKLLQFLWFLNELFSDHPVKFQNLTPTHTYIHPPSTLPAIFFLYNTCHHKIMWTYPFTHWWWSHA